MSGSDMTRSPAAQGRCDANQSEIVKRYEDWFCSVVDLHSVGFGCPDLMVGIQGSTELVEVKTEEGRLSNAQQLFTETWRGSKPVIVRNIKDVDSHVMVVQARLRAQRMRHGSEAKEASEAT